MDWHSEAMSQDKPFYPLRELVREPSEFLKLLLGVSSLGDLEHSEVHGLAQRPARSHDGSVANPYVPERGGKHTLAMLLRAALASLPIAMTKRPDKKQLEMGGYSAIDDVNLKKHSKCKGDITNIRLHIKFIASIGHILEQPVALEWLFELIWERYGQEPCLIPCDIFSILSYVVACGPPTSIK
ncbi:hypothetical protein STEG23_030135, partial [Scotinomys teguina]